MPKDIARPLWRLLLAIANQENEFALNCDECFLVLEYLAEICAHEDTNFEKLSNLVKKHQASCPDCHDYYIQQLENLEAFRQTRS